MNYDGALVMPKNYVAMSDDEMMYLEGGASVNVKLSSVLSSKTVLKIVKYAKGLGVSAAISGTWLTIKYNAKTPYTKTVTRQGKKYTVQYDGTNINNSPVVKVIDFAMDWLV